MGWRQWKSRFETIKPDESHFIVGVDLGEDTSALAFYNVLRKQPELMDLSGGYGRASVPTMMQYVPGAGEWIFGEYAALNKGSGTEATLERMVGRLGLREQADLGGRRISVAAVLGFYLKSLVAGLKNINPNSELAGIVACAPALLADEAKTELSWAFRSAGLDGDLVMFAPDWECALQRYAFGRGFSKERVMILDYAARELRGGVFSLNPQKDGVEAAAESWMGNADLSSHAIDERLKDMFLEFFPNTADRSKSAGLDSFLYQQKDMLLQKRSWQKPAKLFYSTMYPPVQITVTQAKMEDALSPFKAAFQKFAKAVAKSGPVDALICVGGGFEMQWAREAAKEFSPQAIFFKHSKGALAEGASLICAGQLGVFPMTAISLRDDLRARFDIGLGVMQGGKQVFHPVVQQGDYWPDGGASVYLIVNQPVSGTLSVPVYKRDAGGATNTIGALNLDGLPTRPKGATKLKIRFEVSTKGGQLGLRAEAVDMGFAEYPRTGAAGAMEAVLA
ncbi:MAG: DUF5716 family protein [Clostridiales bacterium]|jgi:molecular chaperone DnaK (HSP70)|nr:DUF5716 family protein [Clostridiales bacterium]